MSIRLVLASLLAAFTAACASVMDATREGQPVHDTTIDALYNDPSTWDGKWVRVSGWVDKRAKLLAEKKGEECGYQLVHLDPKVKLHDYDCEDPTIAVVVSGQVDYTCAVGWAETREATRGLMVDPYIPKGEPLFYCNFARGPNLINVIVSRSAGAHP